MFDFDSPLIDFEGRPTDAFFAQLLVKVEGVPAAVLDSAAGARTVGQHLQIQTAVLAGSTMGAGTGHIEFIDGLVSVEADVPLPGVVGDRTGVVVTGV